MGTIYRKYHPALMRKEPERARAIGSLHTVGRLPVCVLLYLRSFQTKNFYPQCLVNRQWSACRILKLAALREQTRYNKKKKDTESKVLGPSAVSLLSSSLDQTYFFERHPEQD